MNKNYKPTIIYGVPGSGKTTLSKMLKRKNKNLQIIEGDKVKKFFIKTIPNIKEMATARAYKRFGRLNRENILKGLALVRQSYSKAALDLLTNKKPTVLEAAFINPRDAKKRGDVFLLTVNPESRHRKQFFRKRKINEANNEEFKAAQMLQRVLMAEARKLKIPILKNGRIS